MVRPLSTRKVDALTVGNPSRLDTDGWTVVTAPIHAASVRHEVQVRLPAGAVAGDMDAWLTAVLMPSMRRGLRVRIPGPVSQRLAENVPRIQEYCHARNPKYRIHEVGIDPVRVEALPIDRGIGCFFSGGLDCLYTVLKHQHEITHLIFVHGFDIPLRDHTLHAQALERIRETSSRLGKGLVEVETNLRSFSDTHLDWDDFHVAGAAFVAHLLSQRLRKVYFAAGMTYDEWKPFGSNPLLTSLWSSERMEFVGDGYEAGRLAKTARIANSDVALRVLRVCWENREGAYNCGTCEKCLRTMAGLRVVRALDRCPTFNRALDLEALSQRRYQFKNPVIRRCWEEIHDAIERRGDDRALLRAVRAFLDQDRGQQRMRSRLRVLSHWRPWLQSRHGR